jgi:hypothetical protein
MCRSAGAPRDFEASAQHVAQRVFGADVASADDACHDHPVGDAAPPVVDRTRRERGSGAGMEAVSRTHLIAHSLCGTNVGLLMPVRLHAGLEKPWQIDARWWVRRWHPASSHRFDKHTLMLHVLYAKNVYCIQY